MCGMLLNHAFYWNYDAMLLLLTFDVIVHLFYSLSLFLFLFLFLSLPIPPDCSVSGGFLSYWLPSSSPPLLFHKATTSQPSSGRSLSSP